MVCLAGNFNFYVGFFSPEIQAWGMNKVRCLPCMGADLGAQSLTSHIVPRALLGIIPENRLSGISAEHHCGLKQRNNNNNKKRRKDIQAQENYFKVFHNDIVDFYTTPRMFPMSLEIDLFWIITSIIRKLSCYNISRS